jgi:hypothetical protein
MRVDILRSKTVLEFWFPTHDTVRLCHGWGTEDRGDYGRDGWSGGGALLVVVGEAHAD